MCAMCMLRWGSSGEVAMVMGLSGTFAYVFTVPAGPTSGSRRMDGKTGEPLSWQVAIRTWTATNEESLLGTFWDTSCGETL